MDQSAHLPLAPSGSAGRPAAVGLWSIGGRLLAIAWRNLWRTRRRTWLTIAGVGFAVFFLIFARSMQTGMFDVMIDNSARLLSGHYQVQAPGYEADPRVDRTFDAGPVLNLFASLRLEDHVSARAQGFALVSVGERSFGGQIIGVQPEVERHWSSLAGMVDGGRYLEQPGEAFVGAVLARNLGLAVGDEVVLLGTARAGGIAALAATVVGTFASGQPALDRSVLKVHLDDFREAWDLAPNEAHAVVGVSPHLATSDVAVNAARQNFPQLHVLSWRDLMREAVQMSDMKAVSTEILFYVIAVIVAFSVINTFMMMVFERTAEIGMLVAIGMRPGLLQIQLQIEALLLSLFGIGAGFLLAAGIIGGVGESGIPIPVEDAQELLKQYNMGARAYPVFDWSAFYTATVLMLVSVQLAALVPGLRIQRLKPVEALRQEN